MFTLQSFDDFIPSKNTSLGTKPVTQNFTLDTTPTKIAQPPIFSLEESPFIGSNVPIQISQLPDKSNTLSQLLTPGMNSTSSFIVPINLPNSNTLSQLPTLGTDFTSSFIVPINLPNSAVQTTSIPVSSVIFPDKSINKESVKIEYQDIRDLEVPIIEVPIVKYVSLPERKKKAYKQEPVIIIPKIGDSMVKTEEYYDPSVLVKKVNIPDEYKNRIVESMDIKEGIIIDNLTKKIYRIFEDKNTYVGYNDSKLSYHSRKYLSKKSFGWGQRKLGLALIQFLTLYLTEKVKNPQLIYAGSAPGENIYFVSKLFPTVRFHLYDPREFNIPRNDPKVLIYTGKEDIFDPKYNIIIYRDKEKGFFTDYSAKYWGEYQKTNNNVYFVSDIRTGDHEKDTPNEFEQSVIRDMNNQSKWHKIINPIKSQLKFRLPYNLANESEAKFVYLKGIIYKGIYNKPTSTECRLVPDGFKDVAYDFKDYESKLFFFNAEVREKYNFTNPLATDQKDIFSPIYSPELLNDYGSVAEAYVWISYLKKMGRSVNKEVVGKLVNAMNKALSGKSEKSLNIIRSLL